MITFEVRHMGPAIGAIFSTEIPHVIAVYTNIEDALIKVKELNEEPKPIGWNGSYQVFTVVWAGPT